MDPSAGQTTVTGVQWLQVSADDAGRRIDNFLISKFKNIPKSKLYKIVRKGELRVNKSRVSVDYKLKEGDQLRIPPLRVDQQPRPARAGNALLELLERSVLYEDRHLLVLNKPSGLAVHGGSGIRMGLIEALRQLRPLEPCVELVHRLDRDTSGAIMVAKRKSMLRQLHAALREGHVDKYYLALVAGQWPGDLQKVDMPLLKNHLESGERVVRVDKEGKPSLTAFRVLERFSDACLMEAQPISGRTHQIRVHARAVHHPLLGDEKYGDPEANKRAREQGLKRLFLHATRLELNLADSDRIVVEAPLPEDLLSVLEGFRHQRQAGPD